MMVSETDRSPETDWRVGVGVQNITPERPIWLYGYACEQRFQPSIGVLDDLYARAIAFEDGEGERCVIVAIDLCTPRKPLARRLTEAVAGAADVSRDNVLINATHTHSGPTLAQEDVEGRFPIDEDQWEKMEEYTEALPDSVRGAAERAVEDLRPARVSFSRGEVDFIANRRELRATGEWAGMGPGGQGRVERSVPILRVDGSDGQLRAVLFGCACHNVTLDPGNLLVSSDYAGFARAAIERDHAGATAIFLQGCGADANTHPRGGRRQWVHVREHGESLGQEVGRVIRDGGFEPVGGPLRMAKAEVDLPLAVDIPREQLVSKAEGPDWEAFNADRMLEMIDRGEELPESYRAPLSLWRFGEALDLVGISGEVTVDYAFRAADLLPSAHAWVLGYSHEVFGYLPTGEIIDQGGYETRGLLPPGTGYFAPQVESVVLESIKRLIRETEQR